MLFEIVFGIRIPNGQAWSLDHKACAFGGEKFGALYVTSARVGLDQADLTAYRHSGSLMRVKTRVRGMPTFEFG